MPNPDLAESDPLSLSNVKRFIAFRVFFNARFYYPVFTILFLDFGISLEQFAILNMIWALTIVALEVPSGALADTIGRRNLVVAAAAIMVVEVGLIAFAPIGATHLVFYLFVANRVLSGFAEAAASGADEALAYDTLKHKGLESKWSHVLEKQMRYQSIAFIIAMSLGAILYDYQKLNLAWRFLGLDWEISKEIAMRLPLFATLVLSVLALITTLGMKETSSAAKKPGVSTRMAIGSSFRKTFDAGKWILHTPLALAIILSGFLFDHIVRMVLTLNSEYYRQIELPEFSFGFIGAGLAMLGVFMPKLGRVLAERQSKPANFLILTASVFAGLWIMARFFPVWSALAMIPVYAGIFLNGFFVSHYLNQITDSEHRATVLSFKGLSFNLAYGAIGYVYAVAISYLRRQPSFEALSGEALESSLFRTVFSWFPYYFLAAAFVIFFFGAYLLAKRQAPTR